MSKDYKFADKTFKNKTSALKYFKQYLQEHDSIEEADYKSIIALMSMQKERVWMYELNETYKQKLIKENKLEIVTDDIF